MRGTPQGEKMKHAEIEQLASNWFTPRLEEQRLAFRGAVQRVLGEAASRGMAHSSPTYGAVENLAQKEVEGRGRTMLDGYQQALTATAGVVPQEVVAAIKRALDTTLLAEAEQVHSGIEYVRNAIKPVRTKTAAELRAHPLQRLVADFDLFCAQLNTERGVQKIHLEDQVREQVKKHKSSFDVFLSYSNRDTEEATRIYNKVMAAGGRIFMAPKEIRPGDDFAVTIRSALVHSDEVWLLLSPNSIKSEWVITEWGAAWALEKKIVPILYRCDNSAMPDRLRGTQSTDLHLIDELIAKTFEPKKATAQ
jgi:hypothetical protein